MIEIVSSPADLRSWNPNDQPFYLELYGETQPLVDEAFAEVVAARRTDHPAGRDAPVYEYWWTIGHPGTADHHTRWRPAPGASPWQDLADTAARVYLYFPVSAGWRASELTATLKYLSPMPEQRDWLKEAAEGVKAVQPLLQSASDIAGLVPGGATASKWLETISKLQVSSVPQSDQLKWSVEKVTFGSADGVMQGVVWTLPRTAFELLGGRITGSLAVSFLPAVQQGATTGAATYQPDDLLANAVVYRCNGPETWSPPGATGGGQFVRLQISPRSPADADDRPGPPHRR